MTEEDKILTESEQDRAITLYAPSYGFGGSLQEITARILADRNDKIRRDMLKEVGVAISKRFHRQMYPIEFYGPVDKE